MALTGEGQYICDKCGTPCDSFMVPARTDPGPYNWKRGDLILETRCPKLGCGFFMSPEGGVCTNIFGFMKGDSSGGS